MVNPTVPAIRCADGQSGGVVTLDQCLCVRPWSGYAQHGAITRPLLRALGRQERYEASGARV